MAKPLKCRIHQRTTYGDVLAVYNSAIAALNAGKLDHAWALLKQSFGQQVLNRWMEFSGKTGTPIRDLSALLNKLRSSTLIDSWQLHLLTTAVNDKPKRLTRQHVDYLAGLVRVFVLDAPATMIGERKSVVAPAPQPVPVAVVIPEDTTLVPEPVEQRDPRQVEE